MNTGHSEESTAVQVDRGVESEEPSKAEEYLKQLQRVQADFINYKRRADAEKIEQARYANAIILSKILPSIDDLERAVAAMPKELADNEWVKGVVLIERKLRSVLEAEGVEEIPSVGKPFDPRWHEAVLHEQTNPETDDVVTMVFRTGYKLHDRVIRAAQVKVGGALPAPNNDEKSGQNAHKPN
jgi:molecular chaperone GrpE